MQYNCQKVRHMIKSHPKMMARIITKLEGKQTFRHWHKLCKANSTEAMAVFIHGLIDVNRGLRGN